MSANINADVAFINAKIYTGEKFDEVNDAFLIQNGRFKKISSTKNISAELDPKHQVIDLKGGRVLPGFIEGHGHLLGIGKSMMMLDLRGLSPEQIKALVKKQASTLPAGAWIKGRGWDQNIWPGKTFPTKDLIDDVSPRHPVYLTRVDGHAALINSAAINLAGITDATANTDGGKIIRDNHGVATGVVVDTAMALASAHMVASSPQENERALLLGMSHCAKLGVTSFHDAGISAATADLLSDFAKKNRLSVRVYAMLDGDDDALVKKYLASGPVHINDTLTIRAIKYFADGALGSRGAALLNDYHDKPGQRGLVLMETEKLIKKTTAAINAGFQVATHAIGDRANRMVLDAYEQALKNTKARDARLRIEHAQLIDPSDHKRFKELSLIAAMQPTHCTSDMAWVPSRIGPKRVEGRAYPWRSLLNHQVTLVLGSDAPVESLNPILGLFAAVTRQDTSGTPDQGFMPEQRLTMKEALHGYLGAAAFAEFNEKEKGKIAKGYLADFVMFDEDILHLPKTAFLQARPAMTVVGGKVVYKK